MIQKTGLAWECSVPFIRYIEDTGIACELITPQMMGAPYFRGKLVSLIIPTGFGNPAYSGLLPALRASSTRINTFLKKGGRVIVFGAMSPETDRYDWLPVPVTYVSEYFSCPVTVDEASPLATILDDFDTSEVDCDGYIKDPEGDVLAQTDDGKAIMVSYPVGEGTVIVTTIHEYPSRGFLRHFCTCESETLF
ncbi:hypothetical protein L0665_02595 [Methanogenium marinum]|uniref:Uncharacterized protein n=1 Tax=Methanogenium marinum TaxID=348610 RepID=A0A9Q4KSS1_9EURY|nr:hypothetical protein [Methanogenium marinum]MDE4907508.1 hypothetical protein [Methanogenium marinum]